MSKKVVFLASIIFDLLTFKRKRVLLFNSLLSIYTHFTSTVNRQDRDFHKNHRDKYQEGLEAAGEIGHAARMQKETGKKQGHVKHLRLAHD